MSETSDLHARIAALEAELQSVFGVLGAVLESTGGDALVRFEQCAVKYEIVRREDLAYNGFRLSSRRSYR